MISRTKRGLLILCAMIASLILTSSFAFAATSKINSKTYTHPSFYKTKLHRLFHGVDVSVWQGNINWKKSKKDGIDFAILRCGYTALSRFTLHQDSTFLKNYKNAKDAGVAIGVYYYACATTKAEAKKEANYVISILKNNDIDTQMPVVMDYEFGNGRANNNYKSLVKSKGKAHARKVYTANAVQFMKTLRASGYEPMFYSYRVMVDPDFSSNYRFNMSSINGKNQYRFWLAQYSSSTSYSGNMEIWQFSSKGKVSGMKGNIDRNFWYYPLNGTGTESGTKNIRDAKISLSGTKMKYDGNAKEPKVTVKYSGNTLSEGSDYTVSYMNNIKKGTATVLVHGKGGYSNDAFTTFTIGDVSNEQIVKSSDEMENKSDGEKPAKVEGINSSGDIKAKTLTLSWAPSDKATRYLVKYKINGAKSWTAEKISGTSYTIKNVKRTDIVSAKVRAQNVNGKTVTNAAYSPATHRYMRTANSEAEATALNKITVKTKKQKDKKGKIKFEITRKNIDVRTDTILTSKTKKVISGEKPYCYDVSVRPVLIRDNVTYYGLESGDVSHIYLNQTRATKKSSSKEKIVVRYNKLEGIGDPKCRILYSSSKNFSKFTTVEKAQDKTRFAVKGLKSGKTYYVKIIPVKNLYGIEYEGLSTKVIKVKTK